MAVSDRQRLNESEARFAALVNAVTDYAIFLLDENGLVSSWNPGAERMKGYRSEEILDQHFSVFYPADDIAAGKPDMELQTAAREGRFEEVGWRVRKDGSRFLASVVITPVVDDDRQLLGFAKVTRDITEQKRREESANQLRLFAEREMIAHRLHKSTVSLLFEIGLELEGLAARSPDPSIRQSIERIVTKTDEAIRQFRALVFRPEPYETKPWS